MRWVNIVHRIQRRPRYRKTKREIFNKVCRKNSPSESLTHLFFFPSCCLDRRSEFHAFFLVVWGPGGSVGPVLGSRPEGCEFGHGSRQFLGERQRSLVTLVYMV